MLQYHCSDHGALRVECTTELFLPTELGHLPPVPRLVPACHVQFGHSRELEHASIFKAYISEDTNFKAMPMRQLKRKNALLKTDAILLCAHCTSVKPSLQQFKMIGLALNIITPPFPQVPK